MSLRPYICSLAFHALLALVAGLWMAAAPEPPDEPARLDAASIDLVIADSAAEVQGGVTEPAPVEEAVPAPPIPVPPVPEPPPAPATAPAPAALPAAAAPPAPADFAPAAGPVAESRLPSSDAAAWQTVVTAGSPPAAARPGLGGAVPAAEVPPGLVSGCDPDYPRESRRRGEQGTVVLDVGITAAGRVGAVSVVSSSGHPALDRAAEEAIRGARFRAARSRGRPVASTARLTYEFRLER